MVATDVKHQIEQVVDDLSREFGDQLGRKRVEDRVKSVYGRFSKAPIQQFVPVLTRRIAREELLKAT